MSKYVRSLIERDLSGVKQEVSTFRKFQKALDEASSKITGVDLSPLNTVAADLAAVAEWCRRFNSDVRILQDYHKQTAKFLKENLGRSTRKPVEPNQPAAPPRVEKPEWYDDYMAGKLKTFGLSVNQKRAKRDWEKQVEADKVAAASGGDSARR